ncbi:hypothetical protein [Frondihabitans australicus]|uniref:hypothetical protein n=1 Tax=Frondihabitans australicus TaxID=386892 RepID=UPI000EAF1784|nr:hypothetical protein [Frondihabitans australicus]
MGVIVGAFVLLQATDNTVVSVMSLYVTEQLRVDIVWAKIELDTAALLEIPRLLIAARCPTGFAPNSKRISSLP